MKKLMAIAAATMLAGCCGVMTEPQQEPGMTVIKQTIVTCTGFEDLPRGEYRCMLLIGKDKYRMGIATVDKSVTLRVRDWAEWTHETNKSKGIQGR